MGVICNDELCQFTDNMQYFDRRDECVDFAQKAFEKYILGQAECQRAQSTRKRLQIGEIV